MKYQIISRLITALILLSITTYASASDFGPFQGKIVDAETEEPIEGVVVLAEWWKTHFFGGSTFHDAQETLTDKNGYFDIPGIWMLNPYWHTGVDTTLTVFKSGYEAISAGIFRDWKAMNQNLPYIWKVEDGRPVFLLRRLTMEERGKNVVPTTPNIPEDKMKLLTEEVNKEYEFKYPTRR